jgi:hypothetical protein
VKNCSVGTEFFIADRPTERWTDMTELIAVLAILKTPKK